MLGTFHNWMVILDRTVRAGGHDLHAGLAAAGIMLPDQSTGGRLPVALTEVTNLPSSGECASSGGDSAIIQQVAGNYGNYSRWLESVPRPVICPSVATTFVNDAVTGLAAGTYVSGRVFNLGPRDRLASHVYAVRSGNLTMCDMLTHDCTDAAQLTNDVFWRRGNILDEKVGK